VGDLVGKYILAWKLLFHVFYLRTTDYLLDLLLGIETFEQVAVEDLELKEKSQRMAKKYQATPYTVLKRVLNLYSKEELEQTVLLDIGSGKGRVALYAAKLGVRKVYGLEGSSSLHERALRNREAFVKRGFITDDQVQFIKGDAFSWQIPKDVTTLFLFNPFDVEGVKRFAVHLQAQKLSPNLEIIFINPRRGSPLKTSGFKAFRKMEHFNPNYRVNWYRR
jgi:SAM-dependent methyltransferase